MKELAVDTLVNARKRKGYPQEMMANMIAKALKQSYSLRQYQKLENGQFPKFKRDVITAVDNILGTNLRELIYEQEVPPKVLEAVSDRTERYIKLIEKQNEISLIEIKELLIISQGMIGALYEHLLDDSKKDKVLIEEYRKVLQMGRPAS